MTMTKERYLDPTRESFDAFKALPRDVPINMLNLVQFYDSAQYPEDHPNAANGWTGARAYKEYSGAMESMVIGPQDEKWDSAFIARYPSSAAFMEMITDPDYKKAVVNRQAAVLTSRLVRFGELGGADGFG
jgi:hypothetical protein